MQPCGILNIAKESGVTSRQVVDRVQRLVRPAKAGHAGTLDPLASGVLLICVGPATRLVQYLQQMPKRYQARFELGRRSPSDDIECEVTELPEAPRPSLEAVYEAAVRLTGPIQQRPPAYSAVKVGGRRAYQLARRGEAVDLRARQVTIDSIDVVRYNYPTLELNIHCSRGTYVRALGRDLAESLGTAAVMSALVRTAVGEFHLDEACSVEDQSRARLAEVLHPALKAVPSLPTVRLTKEELYYVARGRTIGRVKLPASPEYAAISDSGQLVAILKPARRDGELRPAKNFTQLE